MCRRIFDDGPWDLSGGADHLVSHFDYLNASDRGEAARVRSFVEEMFERYPQQDQENLRRRLRSIDNITHLGAFFELALHELMIRTNCRIIAIEPELEETRRSPDFLVECPTGERFYLEATLATGRSQSDAGADRRLREALQVIDSLHSPDFFFHLHVSGVPAAPVRQRDIRRGVEGWLETLNYDEILASWPQGIETLPRYDIEQHGLRVVVSPVPRRRTRGSAESVRSIAGRMLSPLSVESHEAIRNAILGKAGRYGQLDAPYIVAVNSMSDYADRDSITDALFGTPAVYVGRTEDGYEDRPGRVTDGVWHGRNGPSNTRVSAVFSTERLTPWSLAQRDTRLFLNPWARNTFTQPCFGTEVIRVEDDRLQREAGASIGRILDLNEGWPE